jgi:uncharacterized pyridoxal phosphate-containing UPF0001 family protein
LASVTPDELALRRDEILARVARAGGDPGSVRLVAVTKGFGLEAVRGCAAAGLLELGENYASELEEKARRSAEEGLAIRWHFVGSVQRRKVRAIAPFVEMWHGVSRAVEGEEIARRAPRAAVLVQVDYTGRPGRGGCRESEAAGLVEGLRRLGLDVAGLMTVAPQGDSRRARAAFRQLAGLRDRLGVAELSMGMTDDLEAAVEEGATILRVGRGLLGPRPSRRGLRQ